MEPLRCPDLPGTFSWRRGAMRAARERSPGFQSWLPATPCSRPWLRVGTSTRCLRKRRRGAATASPELQPISLSPRSRYPRRLRLSKPWAGKLRDLQRREATKLSGRNPCGGDLSSFGFYGAAPSVAEKSRAKVETGSTQSGRSGTWSRRASDCGSASHTTPDTSRGTQVMGPAQARAFTSLAGSSFGTSFDGLYILRVACHDTPGAVSLAISRGTSCGSGPRCLHGSAVSLWGVSRGHSLGCRAGGPDRNRSIDLLSLADGVSHFDSLSSLVR